MRKIEGKFSRRARSASPDTIKDINISVGIKEDLVPQLTQHSSDFTTTDVENSHRDVIRTKSAHWLYERGLELKIKVKEKM